MLRNVKYVDNALVALMLGKIEMTKENLAVLGTVFEKYGLDWMDVEMALMGRDEALQTYVNYLMKVAELMHKVDDARFNRKFMEAKVSFAVNDLLGKLLG